MKSTGSLESWCYLCRINQLCGSRGFWRFHVFLNKVVVYSVEDPYDLQSVPVHPRSPREPLILRDLHVFCSQELAAPLRMHARSFWKSIIEGLAIAEQAAWRILHLDSNLLLLEKRANLSEDLVGISSRRHPQREPKQPKALHPKLTGSK